LKPYDTVFQQQLAEEVDSATDNAAFPLALQDYTALRAELRAICE
jgi:hypothetical protein